MQFVSFGWITSSLSLYLVHCMDIVCFPRNLDLLSFQATPRSFRSKCFKSLDLRKPLRSIGPEIKGLCTYKVHYIVLFAKNLCISGRKLLEQDWCPIPYIEAHT